MGGDYCHEEVPACKNSSLSEFSLGPVPYYVGIVSNTLSCLASVLIVALYVAWRDLRDNAAQSIITFIAIADFFTASGYTIGSVNLLSYKPTLERCNVFKNICDIESYIVTWATMSSYCWTIILSLYFYFSIAHNRSVTKKLMPLYHVVAWGGPILVAFPLLCFKKLHYAPFMPGLWCYMDIYHNKLLFSMGDNVAAMLTQLPELTLFVVIVLVYVFTVWSFHRQTVSYKHNNNYCTLIPRPPFYTFYNIRRGHACPTTLLKLHS